MVDIFCINNNKIPDAMKANSILMILLGLITLVGSSCEKEENAKPISDTVFKSQVTEYTLLNFAKNEWCKRPGRNCLPETVVRRDNPLKLVNGNADAVAEFFLEENIAEWSIYFPNLSTDPVALHKLQSRKYSLEKLKDPITPGRYIYCFHNEDNSDYFGIPVINI